MVGIARILGVLLIGYGLLGCFFAVLGADQGFSAPIWNEQAWTAGARRGADGAVCVGFALGGLLLALNNRAATVLLALTLVIAAAKTGYDVAFGDPSTARTVVMVRADYIAIGVAAVGLLGSFLVRRRRTTGSADAP
jgi:hypothetical protein